MYTQDDIDALKAAMATGASKVRFGSGPDSREVTYRSLDQMRSQLAEMVAEVSGAARFSPFSYAEFSRD
jgi:roadblock/LC7 domain-containing protein